MVYYWESHDTSTINSLNKEENQNQQAPSPNAQIEANLLEGKNRYASAGTTLQDIKTDLDRISAGLQSNWLGGAYDAYQQKTDGPPTLRCPLS